MPMPRPAPDREKDEQLERLMKAYGSDVLRLCFFYLKNRSDAEDAAQETFLKAYRNLAALKDASKAKAWLISIAVNTAKDMLRGSWFKRVNRSVTPDELPEAAAPFEAPDDSLVREVMRLDKRLRDVILLHYYEELPVQECCHILRLTPSGFYRRLRKAQALLKERLEGWEYD